MKKVLNLFLLMFVITASFFAEDNHYPKLLKTYVTTDVLNIRELPTTSSKKVGKLYEGEQVYISGFSDTRELIDGYNGYWVKIGTLDQNGNNLNAGWVFSKYVELDPKINVSTMKAIQILPQGRGSDILQMEIIRNGKKSIIEVYLDRLNSQDFYTFRWSYGYYNQHDFYYSDPIGTFVYYPSTKEIKHITTLGDQDESAWNLFSDDFRYMFTDGGTSPGVRGLSVRDLKTNEIIYSGNYLRDLDYKNNEITVVQQYDNWNIKRGIIPPEGIEHAKAFQKTLSAEDLMQQEIVIRYRFNLNTRKLTYLDCVLQFVQ